MKTFSKIWISLGLLAIGFGIVMVIIAACNGITFEDIPTFSKTESYSNVKSLDFDIGYGSVSIEEGDSFRIEANNLPEKKFKSYVENGTWVIKSNNSYVSLFGIHLPAMEIGHWKFDQEPDILITIPEGFEADKITLKLGAGVLQSDIIRAKEGDISVGAGTVTIDGLTITDRSEYKIGAGEMNLNNIKASNITVDCNLGEIDIDGDISGDNKISCDVGSVEINLSEKPEDYFYKIDRSIGDVTINEESYTSIHNKSIGNETASKKLFLDCNVGEIKINNN